MEILPVSTLRPFHWQRLRAAKILKGDSIAVRLPGASIERWRYRVRAFDTRSLGHLVHFKVALRRNAESVCYAVKEGEHRRDVHRLGNLGLTPTVLTQDLYIFRGRAIRRLGHLGDIFQQCAVCIVERRLLEVARSQRLDCFLFCSLNTQEVSMRIQSIRTAIQPGDPAGDRFFCPAREVPFREVDRIAEAHNLAQKIGAMAKALENARHLLPP